MDLFLLTLTLEGVGGLFLVAVCATSTSRCQPYFRDWVVGPALLQPLAAAGPGPVGPGMSGHLEALAPGHRHSLRLVESFFLALGTLAFCTGRGPGAWGKWLALAVTLTGLAASHLVPWW